MKIVVISPTYNESKNIAKLVEIVFSINSDYHLLIVDDNSPDGTADIVESLQKKYKNLHLEKRPGKAGLGTAYCYGFKWSIENGFDVMVQIDADMSHDPCEIPKMVELLKHNDYIIGSRYCDGVSVVRWPIRRLILSYGANLYSKIVTGMPISDATGGYKVWKKQVLNSIKLDTIRSQGYSFQIEMNYRAWKNGFKYKEHPIIFMDRTIGESKMSKLIVWEAIFMVWRLRFSNLFGKIK
ncbi:MAG: dolichyl-phosphate beta-D-mannosyltransferase [Candidatus Marinimicrobia bacterium]|nr:dolichyl-phosphate beta-D-mannosyltransferase [Candidatus Neomarinimicrobiota bacterium]|tara:strand:- start:69276 stop:69992 length:717 start_codon:yes stop_codon:yes gene_type:complete